MGGKEKGRERGRDGEKRQDGYERKKN